MTVLNTAAHLRSQYPDVHFQFYSSDAIDVLERLEHGSIDFSIFLEPIDISEYNYISLPESSRWGLLMPSDCKLAENSHIGKEDLLNVPLVFHRRTGLQQLISHCFRPLNPPLEIHYALIWKRTAFQSKAAEIFLRKLKQLLI